MKTLLRNAKVLLKDSSFAQAVGFDSASGKIIFAGSNNDASDKDYDEVIRLDGRLVIPAFTEGHCHFIEGSFINSRLNLREAACKDDFVKGIREYKAANDGWIYGGFFADANIRDGFLPEIGFLDSICPDTPVIISRFDTHSAFANSLALNLAGIDAEHKGFTDDEVTVVNGRLTGELKERARDHVMDLIPDPPAEEMAAAAEKQMKKFHSQGITAISDITQPHDLGIYELMLAGGMLKLRVDSRLPFTQIGNLSRVRKEFEAHLPIIKFDSLKAFYDGSLSSKTSYMHHNFRNESHNGIRTEFVNSGEFAEYAERLDRKGVQMSVHAIGDKAVTDLLDLAEHLNKLNGPRDRRFRIEHAQHIRPGDMRRFAELNVIASVQPSHLFSDAKTAVELLADSSTEHNYPELLKHGGHVCFGTDFPIVSESPFETVYFAMTRKASGFPGGFHPGYNMPLSECIKAYTIENAYATFEENIRGTIEPGKIADIAVIDGDLFEMNEDEIRNARVHQTYFMGEKVWSMK